MRILSRLTILSILPLLGCGTEASVAPSQAFPGDVGGTSGGGAGGEAGEAGTGGIPDVGGSGGEGGSEEREPKCGNLYCEPSNDEDCETCPVDCGQCPVCDLAPTCTGAMAAPTATVHVSDCDNAGRKQYSCGVGMGVPASETTCLDPQVRIRIRKVTIDRGFWDGLGKQLFCMVTAEDGNHSELALTPVAAAGHDEETEVIYPLADSIFWGQGDLFPSISNILITYDCYLGDGGSYEGILDDISDRAADVAEDGGLYGWVFGAVAVVGTVIGSSLGSINDDRIVNIQQTIDAGALLDFTNGRAWQIRVDDGSGFEKIMLDVEAWGCADARPVIP
jgi:hypothetical protein